MCTIQLFVPLNISYRFTSVSDGIDRRCSCLVRPAHLDFSLSHILREYFPMAIGVGGKLGRHVIQQISHRSFASFGHFGFLDAIFQDSSHFGVAGHVPACVQASVRGSFDPGPSRLRLFRLQHALGRLGFDPDLREDPFAPCCVFHRVGHSRTSQFGFRSWDRIQRSLQSGSSPFGHRIEPGQTRVKSPSARGGSDVERGKDRWDPLDPSRWGERWRHVIGSTNEKGGRETHRHMGWKVVGTDGSKTDKKGRWEGLGASRGGRGKCKTKPTKTGGPSVQEGERELHRCVMANAVVNDTQGMISTCTRSKRKDAIIGKRRRDTV